MYLCFKVISSAPFITMIRADSVQRDNSVDVCTFILQRQLPGRMGLFLESER